MLGDIGYIHMKQKNWRKHIHMKSDLVGAKYFSPFGPFFLNFEKIGYLLHNMYLVHNVNADFFYFDLPFVSHTWNMLVDLCPIMYSCLADPKNMEMGPQIRSKKSPTSVSTALLTFLNGYWLRFPTRPLNWLTPIVAGTFSQLYSSPVLFSLVFFLTISSWILCSLFLYNCMPLYNLEQMFSDLGRSWAK